MTAIKGGSGSGLSYGSGRGGSGGNGTSNSNGVGGGHSSMVNYPLEYGGSGVVVITHKTADISSLGTRGIISTSGICTIHTFTSSGAFFAPN